MENQQQPWNPSLIYRANRPEQQRKSILEEYGETNILTFLRFHMPDPHPGHNFGPMIQAAANTCEKIAMFENNEALLSQVVFGIVHPTLCHPGLRDIASDRELVTLLLIRHFKKYGGLLLPPLAEVRSLQDKHEQGVRADLAAGKQPVAMVYPNWYVFEITWAV
ncbi:hypothetical protein EJ02DRAFT_414603 [Clathrospora elynae]|uniref:Uncharacterized protein n=1 Tax=Clathrospora elynae TaxID=706981 RepID=A0A6A5S9F9_9PLEO|nr:hypothetical protein EJ02DRAFT_414603 [Clathrospora elynae]